MEPGRPARHLDLALVLLIAGCDQADDDGFQAVGRVPEPVTAAAGLRPLGMITTEQDHDVREITDLIAVGEHVLSCGNKSSLGIWDLSDAAAPRKLSVLRADGAFRCDSVAVAPDDGMAYVGQRATSSGEASISAVEIARPVAPNVLATLLPDHDVAAVLVVGEVLAVAAHDAGLVFYDRGAAGALVERSRLSFVGNAIGLFTERGSPWLHVLSRDRGLYVIDPTDPDQPRVVSHLDLPAPPYAMAAFEDRAWLALGSTGVATLDRSTPFAPELLSVLDTPGSALDLSVLDDGEGLAVADWEAVRLVDLRGPDGPVIAARAPVSAVDSRDPAAPPERAVAVLDLPSGALLGASWGELRTWSVDVAARAGDLVADPPVARLQARSGEDATAIVSIRNDGFLPITVKSLEGSGGVLVSGPSLPWVLPAGERLSVSLRAPTGVVVHDAVVTLVSDDVDEPTLHIPSFSEGDGFGIGDAPELTFAAPDGEPVPLRPDGDDHAVLLDYFATF